MSFFAYQRVAEGYANDRPKYHPLIMQKIQQELKLEAGVAHALDIGCGSGLSTTALKELADEVTGIDSSAEMIAVAQSRRQDRITYLQSAAEQLPFHDQAFDLITVAGAINWIDRARFLPEARRVLKPEGWLIIYDNTITDQMRENPEYTRWYHEQYLGKFPKPPRDEAPLTSSECEANHFKLMNSEDYSNDVELTCEEYIAFILTQSNVIAAVDMGSEEIGEARSWMRSTLASVIPQPKGTFQFGGYIWYLQRQQ